MFALTEQAVSLHPPKDWLSKLRTMVTFRQVEDVVTSEALCVRIAGDFVAGMVLHRLLHWMPKGNRADGAIYHSDRDFFAELGLSYAQMRRARDLLGPVVTCWLEKAEGSPTYHYQVNADALVEGVASVMGLSVVMVREWIFERVENGFSRESKNHNKHIPKQSPKGDLNTNTTKDSAGAGGGGELRLVPPDEKDLKSQKKKDSLNGKGQGPLTDVAKRLKQAGLKETVARQYGWLDAAEVQELLTLAEYKARNNQLRSSKGGYIQGGLKKMAARIEDEYKRALAHGTFAGSLAQYVGDLAHAETVAMAPVQGFLLDDPWAEVQDDEPEDIWF